MSTSRPIESSSRQILTNLNQNNLVDQIIALDKKALEELGPYRATYERMLDKEDKGFIQIRLGYKIKYNSDVFVGSSHILNPPQAGPGMLKSLCAIMLAMILPPFAIANTNRDTDNHAVFLFATAISALFVFGIAKYHADQVLSWRKKQRFHHLLKPEARIRFKYLAKKYLLERAELFSRYSAADNEIHKAVAKQTNLEMLRLLIDCYREFDHPDLFKITQMIDRNMFYHEYHGGADLADEYNHLRKKYQQTRIDYDTLIPAEIPIHRPVVDRAKITVPDSMKNIRDAFNELHITSLEKRSQEIIKFLHEERNPCIAKSIIKIIIEYCSIVEFARRFEPFRNGISDIKSHEHVFLTSDHAYPIMISYYENGATQEEIRNLIKENESCSVVGDLVDHSVKYKKSDENYYRSICYFTRVENAIYSYDGKLYGNGISVIDSQSEKPTHFTLQSEKGLTNYCKPQLQVLKIPYGSVADVTLGGLSYTLTPLTFCQHRVFHGDGLRVDKIYNSTPSRFGSIFCGQKKKKIENLSESKQEKRNTLTS